VNTRVQCLHCSRFYDTRGIKQHEKACKKKGQAPDIKTAHYRDICFHYHDKCCVICGERRIVEVHHLNEDHSDNRPENLIALCPTHHQYWHSKEKDLVLPQVEQYIKRWRKQNHART
jgi:hypothetical protein